MKKQAGKKVSARVRSKNELKEALWENEFNAVMSDIFLQIVKSKFGGKA